MLSDSYAYDESSRSGLKSCVQVRTWGVWETTGIIR
ncbi:hypothetical protein [Enterobacter phage 03_vB_Eclo_IJM]|nr:hypothetical protein [Enterobacter phage 02_vB_Eclo_IJM]UZT50249.1 hypothetical protein [Enterobacter phage 03_vB_Eclo_IJM]